jgi:hypothetical protein
MTEQEIRTAALNATIELYKIRKDKILPTYENNLQFLDALFAEADFIEDYIRDKKLTGATPFISGSGEH